MFLTPSCVLVTPQNTSLIHINSLSSNPTSEEDRATSIQKQEQAEVGMKYYSVLVYLCLLAPIAIWFHRVVLY